ncbi:MAG: peptidoglycan DD-metalloendopeptidase family protein [Paludibacteraceae bacterium]|nr:peptidoglycan DD-metalloendopeptidase family protein [Paludibacteraceae bacterium]
MTRQTLIIIFAAILTTFVCGMASAQNPGYEKFRAKAMAGNSNFSKQSHLLDSVIAHYVEIDTEEDEDVRDQDVDNPGDDIYNGAWSTDGVNANRVALCDVPDSVTISCSGYVPPVVGITTSHFGPRWRRIHYGIDIALRTGEPVGAAFDGKVRVTKFDRRGYGYYVVLRHDNGLETVYGHLSEIKVFEGQHVVAGQCIGLGGSTGRSTGPHLHFETRFMGNPINPEKIINFATNEPHNKNFFLVKTIAFDYAKSSNYRSSYAADNIIKGSRGNSYAKGRHRYHKVRKGETLSSIAKRHGTTVNKLCKLNRISRNSKLRPGQRLRYT